MKKNLITGATGNIGYEVIHYLTEIGLASFSIAAVRNIEKAKSSFVNYPALTYREFDFENPDSFASAFDGIEILFLLRPPHISNIEKYFVPLLTSAKKSGINKVIFLSVQGAEKSNVIPHNKIERLIKSLDFDYIFVRPGYFMQNLTTTLLPELQKNRSITLPAGKAKFNWIDVKNIGEATANLIRSFKEYSNQSFEITGAENKNFQEVVDILSEVTKLKFTYHSINPIRFYFKKRKEGMQSGFAIVMTILHFLPRLQKEPEISDAFKRITGKTPTLLRTFIKREKENFIHQV